MVKTLCTQCRGTSSISGRGTKESVIIFQGRIETRREYEQDFWVLMMFLFLVLSAGI